MRSYSTADNALQAVSFNGKVIENALIRLVLVPEYGGRVLSFVYKPTNHEYLYQSDCGSPYGMNDGNFYYDWLMVYGGIFPTFPEPEHGKTWLLPWKFETMHESPDSVVVAMEYTDTTAFSGAPGKFNNGITGITCRVEIGVHRGESLWDFTVKLKNNKNQKVKYEYWTCTTLTPGSDSGNTRAPLNTKLVVPIEQYIAGWSPGNWIGSYGQTYPYENIDYLNEWRDMGIAYGYDLRDPFWGVINQENMEGVFRISENRLTPGLKFWTWGRDNVDNDLFDFSNGGRDNYIELWAGVSEAFFSDATLAERESIQWLESYGPTVNLSDVIKMNEDLAVHIDWQQAEEVIRWEIFAFKPGQDYLVRVFLQGDSFHTISSSDIITQPLGNSLNINVNHIPAGVYMVQLEVHDSQDNLLIQAEREISLVKTGIPKTSNGVNNHQDIAISPIGNRSVKITLPNSDTYTVKAFTMAGQLAYQRDMQGQFITLQLPDEKLYLIHIKGASNKWVEKILVN